MPANFLHGVETIELQDGIRTVQEVKSAVIGLIGIAPTEFGKNECKLINSDVLAANYGKQIPGFTIPQTLDKIFAFGTGTVIVVNVFDAATHLQAVVDEAKTVADGKLKLAAAPIGNVTLKDNAGEPSAYVKGTDYTLDEYGNFKVIAGRIPNATTIKFSYNKLNAAAVISSHIVGEVGEDGSRTGIKALDLAFNKFGFKPKILIAPGFSQVKAVSNELISAAERMRAITYIDSEAGDTIQEAIEARGNAAKSFGTSNRRAVPCYPGLKMYDASKETGEADADTNTVFPYSAWMAGATAYKDREFGYWYSPSNTELKAVTGVETEIYASTTDENSDSNLLNAAGIVTVFNAFGTGYKTWGNRNASFPTNTVQDNFIANLRVFDMVHESLELAALEYNDRPLTQALVNDIRQSGNAFCKTLIGRGALTEGSRVVFNKADNPPASLANGQVSFRIIKDAPAPAERITYLSIIDISLKSNIS